MALKAPPTKGFPLYFDAFSLDKCFLNNVKAMGYEAPTPIQEQSIPPVMQGRDVMGLAQTGTGKTAAFMLPLLNRLLLGRRSGTKPRALVVAPTRELAEQICDSGRDLGKGTGLRIAAVYGGVGFFPQVQKLRAGVDVIVACPGRLLDHVGRKTVDLSGVEVLVLDEADHMFDMGFLPAIKRILETLPQQRQTLLFSATMPAEVRKLALDILNDPVTVSIGRTAPAETVSHHAYPVPQHLKTPLLLELLKNNSDGSVLVFTRTKHRAKRLGEQLAKAGHRAASIQGNLSQNKRQEALDGFREGRFRILVATDIAARGIDVSRVAHVVNYDMPDTSDAYTHRIGRTGRAERSGCAHSFMTREDQGIVRAVESLLRKPLPRNSLEGFDYSAPRPAQDTEFSRPPLQRPQRQRGVSAVERDDAGRSGRGRRPERNEQRPAGPGHEYGSKDKASSARGAGQGYPGHKSERRQDGNNGRNAGRGFASGSNRKPSGLFGLRESGRRGEAPAGSQSDA